ncbi:MAG: hypothetical protein GY756_26900 [bacterium]|nr:hypothetical protein [bacterium]
MGCSSCNNKKGYRKIGKNPSWDKKTGQIFGSEPTTTTKKRVVRKRRTTKK